ncbi:RES domain-containing protein, partial [Burkholderia gladioli]
MKLYRIADRRHPVWSGTGSMLVGGRFNSPGQPVIYAA